MTNKYNRLFSVFSAVKNDFLRVRQTLERKKDDEQICNRT
jgi:hypothetical protein